MSISNIEKVYLQADVIDILEGKQAYFNYNTMLKSLANYYSFGFVQTVACFAALSPNNDYVGNLRSTVSIMQGIINKKEVKEITVSTYNACKLRAYDYLIGNKDFLIETKGLKTKNFYWNILKPENKNYITIDGHMVCVWKNKRMTMVDVARNGFNYNKIAHDFKLFAQKLDLIPNQLQAILWFTWKRINNVIYNPQLHLFDNSNWNVIVPPESIQPF